jgi:GDP-L-fucose synthase
MDRVLVTGSSGFLGSHVVDELYKRGYNDIVTPRSNDYDLRKREHIDRLLHSTVPDTVIHLAAVCGGIAANQAEPARFFYENLIMGAELIDAAYRTGVRKFVQIGTVCAYPKFTPVPFKEEDIWNGYPEETNAPYGLAKKALLTQCQAYRQQYGFNAIYLVPVNLYGPRDNFNLASSHVMPALIRKCMFAKRNGMPEVMIWGDGSASREFLYAADCAEAIVSATEKYNDSDPVNLGSGQEVNMKDLALMVKKATGYEGTFTYDTSKPNGQPRRCLDVTKAQFAFGFTARTNLEEGLRKTVEWYAQNLDSNI